jgi:hypothetical protein
LSIRDPFYADIERALASPLDTDLFERLAAEIVESKGYPTNLAVGGADNGYDFELLDSTLEPGPGVVTTSDRVTTNLKKNLASNRSNCPNAAKKTFVVTSTVLTSVKRNNLKKAAGELGYVYLGAADRADVARYIYAHPHWASELLGLAGEPSALSVVARTSRPLLDVALVGRDAARQSLRELQGDAMVVGSPGSGKTALLADLAASGEASFMVSRDMSAVANALRAQQPKVVVIDDLDDDVAATRDLVQLRTEIGADFRIVVTDWERCPELEQAMGLASDDIVVLDQLSRDEIVEVVKSVGVAGPRQLIREIVDQSEGMPGLAVTLTQAALSGDYEALFAGDRLGLVMESAVNQLLGNAAEGNAAILALAAIAFAGDVGLALEETADFVGISRGELQRVLRRLTSGGIVRSDARRVSIRPRSLRSYLIRKAFFGPGPADYQRLLAVVPNSGQTAVELVKASRAGAVVPDLLDIVLSSGDTMAARYYVGTGEREAREYLRAAPEMSIHVAHEALHTAPEVVIPSLLVLALDDRRELHNTPEQPLRLIKDWGNSAFPGGGEAVERKRTVINAALKWAAEGGDFETACRACCEVLRTSFEGSETDPGAGMTIHLVSGMLTDEEIAQLIPLWEQVRNAIGQAASVPWPSLLSLASSLVHPRVLGDHPIEVFAASRGFAQRVLDDLGELGRPHPAVLERLSSLRARLGLEEIYEIPHDYAVLLGERDFTDWERDEEQRAQQIAELADQWAVDHPNDFAARMRWLADEAALAGGTGYDRSPHLCYLVAQRVSSPRGWLDAVIAGGLGPTCQQPFVDCAIAGYEEGWETLVSPMLGDTPTESVAIDAALRAPSMSDELWPSIAPLLPRYEKHIDILCLRKQVSTHTLGRLLTHESSVVVHATAVGMWTGEKHGQIPEELRTQWEDAVVRIDDDEYWLEEILASSPDVAARWLRARIEHNDWRALGQRKNVSSACQGLDHDERLQILGSVGSQFYNESVAAALIGDSEDLYREVLRDSSMDDNWEAPLRRSPDDEWRRLAGIALEEGKSPRDLAGASMLRSESWSGPHSAHLQSKIDAFTPWLDDPVPEVREIARQAIQWFSESKERALADERREAIEGID